MSSSPMLSTGELALLLAPADNPQANTQQSVVQEHTDGNAENDCSDCNDNGHPEDDREATFSEYSLEMSLETNHDYNDGNQPAAGTNGTYSESLMRLQTGYLHAISVLEDRNKQDRKLERQKNNLELQNNRLEAELRAARLWPHTHKKTQRDLELSIAKKNETIKEKNSKINKIEARNYRLEEELRLERKKTKKLSTALGTQNEAIAERSMSTVTSGGTMILAIREKVSTTKLEHSTTYPATKKRKYDESVYGDSDNPVVLD
ncbi:hypothetical protein IQ06DRAFT_350097 [Phaeosphaeriaceae sp. SRC1lsM3a]|nr:hypothetical protein IQ06DRAFT_350097 [Stagonospora sp. SRC1lsM3a]